MRSSGELRAAHARSFALRASARCEHARMTAARLVLVSRNTLAPVPHAPVVAARIESTRRATASFVENFSLAVERVSGGIKHGTIRYETNHRMRVERILPTMLSRGCQESSSRVTPSRHTVLSRTFIRTPQSRSDRTSVGHRSREDQGGPT